MKCYLDIVGDDFISFSADLTEEQIKGIRILLDNPIQISGKFIPIINFTDEASIKEAEEERRKEIEKQNKEYEAKLKKAMGLDFKEKSAMQLAFEKAKKGE